MVPLSAAARALWGKSDRDRKDGIGHPLICHMVDVAACVLKVLEREPARTRDLYAQDFGYSSFEAAKPWLLLFIALHDLGKASPSFQSMWPIGVGQVNAVGLKWQGEPNYVPHGFISQVVIVDELKEQINIHFDLLRHMADAVACHHGTRATPKELIAISDADGGFGQPQWQAVRLELFLACVELFAVDLQKTPHISQFSAAAFERLAGVCSFADWLGSNQDFFEFAPNMTDLASYWQRSLQQASEAIDRIGWTQRTPLATSDPQFTDVFPFAPRPLQLAMIEVLQNTTKPTFILIEAPMGEGKTEAGFFAHLVLQRAVGHRGMYMALPTRATGNSMYKRTAQFLNGFGRKISVDLQLLHGAALLNDLAQNLRIKNIDERKEGKQFHNVQALEWFGSKKRGLLAEYAVGTVDQALMGIMPVRHQFVRIWGLGNRTVIIDEVHAYDVYTSTLIHRLLQWLHALGSSVILMSATLSKKRREELLSAYAGKPTLPQDVEYPRIFKVSGDTVAAKAFAADPERAQNVEVIPISSDLETMAEQLLASVAVAGCAACIVNTVQRAQDLYRLLIKRCDEEDICLSLFHARYPAQKRQMLENRVLERFDKNGCRPIKAILIGTQVLEQSLDYDVDVMFTDLAPIDLVLQRVGRLWRHRRKNRAVQQQCPRLFIAGLATQAVAPELHKDLYWDRIYDEDILLRSYGVLSRRATLQLPSDIDSLIEAVYGDEMVGFSQELVDKIDLARQKVNLERLNQQVLAKNTMLAAPDDYLLLDNAMEMYDPDENPNQHMRMQVATRLGKPSVTVIPIHLQPDGRYRVEGRDFELDKEPSFLLGKHLYLQNLLLSRAEIVHMLLKEGVPPTWQEHPLLRNCYPLQLLNNKAVFGQLEVELDDVLGVVYRKLRDK
jgi:CRISPR-associated endonuclease/helicase Cas3